MLSPSRGASRCWHQLLHSMWDGIMFTCLVWICANLFGYYFGVLLPRPTSLHTTPHGTQWARAAGRERGDGDIGKKAGMVSGEEHDRHLRRRLGRRRQSLRRRWRRRTRRRKMTSTREGSNVNILCRIPIPHFNVNTFPNRTCPKIHI